MPATTSTEGNCSIDNLALASFNAHGIKHHVRKESGESYSIGYIYTQMSDMGISAKKYRNGETDAARELIRQSLQDARDKALPTRQKPHFPRYNKPMRLTA